MLERFPIKPIDYLDSDPKLHVFMMNLENTKPEMREKIDRIISELSIKYARTNQTK